jgi:peptidase M28-like protein
MFHACNVRRSISPRNCVLRVMDTTRFNPTPTPVLLMRSLPVLALLFIPSVLLGQGPAPEPSAPAMVPAPAPTLSRSHVPKKTKAEITAEDLMTRLYIFADDSMQGRDAGTAGNLRGTDYIAREVARMGLVPMGDNGTYFQILPFKTRTVDTSSALTAAGTPLSYGPEWAGRANQSFHQENLSVVYGGLLGDTTVSLGPDQVTGKLVVMQLPPGGGNRTLRVAARRFPTAAAVGIVGPDQLVGLIRRPATFIDDPAPAAPAAPLPPTLFFTQAGAGKLFDGVLGQLTPGTAGKPITVDLKVVVEPVAFPARNVVAMIPGNDPALKGQYIAIGAHNDHIGMTATPVDHDSMRIFLHRVRPGGAEDNNKQATPEQQALVNADLAAWRAAHPNGQRADSISNGADDDGSGSVSVLEIAEKLQSMKQKLKRSVLFVWHVGEERGLLGSAWFTDHPTVPRDSIVAQLNMDMVGRGDAWDVTGAKSDGSALHGNPNYLQIVGSRRLSTELGDIIEKVNIDGKHNLAFDYSMDANGHPMNIYCRSDHYEYARYGIPIAFFTTGGHSDYHQVTDEPMYIDYPHMTRVDRLVADVAVRLANLDHRVVVDKEKPDPRGSCRQ